MGEGREERLARALTSLAGVRLGDAFGSQFFVPGNGWQHIVERRPPAGFWEWTDDAEMAFSVVRVLAEHGTIDQDALAASFAEHFDFYRGYGPGTAKLLHVVLDGQPWREAVAEAFSGAGSYGNGAAMRVAPLGAYFADDLVRVVEEAERSAAVTHTHPEAVAGAIAVAVAAALAARQRASGDAHDVRAFIDVVLEATPDGQVHRGLWRARGLHAHRQVQLAVRELGNGSSVTAADTVPFTIWAAAHHRGDLKEAIWTCVSAGGDVDTTAAIVGGIVAAGTDRDELPEDWLIRTEPAPDWFLAAVE